MPRRSRSRTPGPGPDRDRQPGAGTPTGEPRRNAAVRALQVLKRASKVRTFWALVAGFAICGATTNGLIGTHFIPSAHDHGMSQTTAAGLLAVVGIFDIVGTIASGWLTDRFNPRILLAVYYQFRGIGLLVLPLLLSATVQPSMIVFVVIYGLDWVATVPPTAAICRQVFGADGSVVFGWVFAAHQLGAAAAALAAGAIRDATGQYTYAWFGAAAMCTIAAVISATIRKDAGKKEACRRPRRSGFGRMSSEAGRLPAPRGLESVKIWGTHVTARRRKQARAARAGSHCPGLRQRLPVPQLLRLSTILALAAVVVPGVDLARRLGANRAWTSASTGTAARSSTMPAPAPSDLYRGNIDWAGGPSCRSRIRRLPRCSSACWPGCRNPWPSRCSTRPGRRWRAGFPCVQCGTGTPGRTGAPPSARHATAGAPPCWSWPC